MNPPPPGPFSLPPHDTCLLYLVRHGATDSNLARPPRLQGRSVNRGLSPEGRWQALRAAGQLTIVPLAAVYSSPLLRAWETAERIAARQQLSVAEVKELVEVDVGRWEGKTWQEIAREDPERHGQFLRDPAECGYLEGENLGEVLDRVLPAIRSIMQRHRGQYVAAVAHNVVNRCVLAELLGIPMARARHLAQDNGAINVLRLRDTQLELLVMNANLHLVNRETTAVGDPS